MSSTQMAAGVELEPFLGSVTNVFEVMLGESLHRIEEKPDATPAKDSIISSTAVIGLKGTAYWTLTLVIPDATGKAITKRFLQTDEELPPADVADALGELANMVAGGAKAQLSQRRSEEISISLPTVITGSDYSLGHPHDTRTLTAHYGSDLGDFAMNVTYCEKTGKAGKIGKK